MPPATNATSPGVISSLRPVGSTSSPAGLLTPWGRSPIAALPDPPTTARSSPMSAPWASTIGSPLTGRIGATHTKTDRGPHSRRLSSRGWRHCFSKSTAIGRPRRGDGRAESGETIEITIQLKNKGRSEASGLHGTLSLPNPEIVMASPQVSFPPIPAGETESAEGAFVIRIPLGFLSLPLSFWLRAEGARGLLLSDYVTVFVSR